MNVSLCSSYSQQKFPVDREKRSFKFKVSILILQQEASEQFLIIFAESRIACNFACDNCSFINLSGGFTAQVNHERLKNEVEHDPRPVSTKNKT